MNSPIPSPAFLGFLRRRLVEVCAALYGLTVIYNSLVPLDFSPGGPSATPARESILGLPAAAWSMPDAASNVAYYWPLGVLLCAALVKVGWGRWLATGATVLIAAGLSYVLERCQLASATRVASAHDWMCNLAGAAAGAAASPWAMVILRNWSKRLAGEVRDRPSLALVSAGGLFVVLLALVPLDITFSMDRLRAAVGAAHVIPFEKLREVDPTKVAHPQGEDFYAHHVMLRDWWMLSLDYAGWLVLYAGLTLAACYYLRAHCEMRPFRAGCHAVGMSAVLALGSSAFQLLVISRGLDATIPLVQIVGALLGALVHGALLQNDAMDAPAAARIQKLATAGLVAVAGGLVLRQLAPFGFSNSADVLAYQIARIDWLPMGAYQASRLPSAVDDVVQKLVRFGALGAMWAIRMGSGRPWRIGAWVSAAVLVTEVVQLFLPSRIPGVTDVLLAWFGTTAGVCAHAMGATWYAQVRGPAAPVEPIRIEYRVELGPPEESAAAREAVPSEQKSPT